jgi:tetratricopeptide (TPR) repeat protein
MKEESGKRSEAGEVGCMAQETNRLGSLSEIVKGLIGLCGPAVIVALICVSIQVAAAQDTVTAHLQGGAIQGRVLNAARAPVADVFVRLEQAGIPGFVETRSDEAGAFSFAALKTGRYLISAEKSGLNTHAATVVISSEKEQRQVDIFLENFAMGYPDSGASSPLANQAMEFSDKPTFTIAGVADWTAAGGHGSDSSLRTSEALTRETLALKSMGSMHGQSDSPRDAKGASESETMLRAALAAAPKEYETNHKLGDFYFRAGKYAESVRLLQTAYQINPTNSENEGELAQALNEAGDSSQAREHIQKLLAHSESADLHRVAGEVDEKSGDSLAAVHELEKAAHLDPSEQNYFEWGSELLLHRAVLQAEQVFGAGAAAYPKSSRMLSALGTALFANARYDEAALRLCAASNLNPADAEPYMFMGRAEMAAPNPLPCVEEKLARFVKLQPSNALANYFYAMAVWKGQAQPPDQQVLQEVEVLLNKAINLDDKCGEAYLQLGNLSSLQRSFEKAIDYYTKAIEVSPQLAEVHYRLGMAYDRIGDPAKAQQEFQLHDELKKQQAAEVDRQRREVKQFLVDGQPTYPTEH